MPPGYISAMCFGGLFFLFLSLFCFCDSIMMILFLG